MGLETKNGAFRIRMLACLMAVVLTVTLIPLRTATAAGMDDLNCKGGVVMDAESGKILWGRNEEMLLVPGSMVKLMTAFVVYEAIRNGEYTMDSVVPISASTARFSRNTIYTNVPLNTTSTYTVRQLMEAMMVKSACAASRALAEFTSGSEGAFVNRMNAAVLQLQMNAVFVDSYGGSPYNKVTPASMAKLGRALLIYHPEITEFTSEAAFSFEGTIYYSTNRFIRKVYTVDNPYVVVDGLKTGTTSAAGRCLCSTAVCNGKRVVAVMMKENSVGTLYADSAKALCFGLDYAEPYDPSDMLARFSDVDYTKWFTPAIETMLNTGLMTGASEFYFMPDATLTRAQVCQILYNFANRPYMTDVKSFSDVSTQAWFAPAIAWCKMTGMILGNGSGTFSPDDPISREAMITMLYRYLQSTGVAAASSDTSKLNTYADRSQIAEYAQESLNWAVSGGYITGMGGDVLSPSSYTTRAQMAQLLTRIVS